VGGESRVEPRGDSSVDDFGDALRVFLGHAHGQPFCDGCLAAELDVGAREVRVTLDGDATGVDRGSGRCSVCGQTVTVTRWPAA